MIPYTLRERRENIAQHGPEAYPGQHEATLASLVQHDTVHAAMEREVAAEARHGGRYLTEQLATRGGEDAVRLRTLQDEGDLDKVSRWWAYSLSPTGGTGSGRDSTQRYARNTAAIGGVDWEHSAYWQPPQLPEAAFDWPIYRAALTDPLRCECGDGWLDSSGGCSSEDHDAIMADRAIPESELRALAGDR